MVEQDLGEGATRGMAHDDRWLRQRPDDCFEVFDDGRDGECGDDVRVGLECLDLDLEAGVAGCEDAEALLLVVGDPVFPAAGRDPEAVDQDDGVGSAGHDQAPCVLRKASRSLPS